MGAVTFVGHVTAKPGCEQQLADLITEFVERVRVGDPATLSFGFYTTDVAGTYVAVEVYESSDAAMAHLDNVSPLFGPLGELLAPGDNGPPHVYGDPSPELRERYTAFGPVFHPAADAF